MKQTLNTTMNRSELAAYDTIGNRLWSADNVITNEYDANNLNQYMSVGRAAPARRR